MTRSLSVQQRWLAGLALLFFTDAGHVAEAPAVGFDVQPGNIHITVGGQLRVAYVYQGDQSWFRARDYSLPAANPFGRKALGKGAVSQVTVRQETTFACALGSFCTTGRPTDRRT